MQVSECDKCGEHALECECKPIKNDVVDFITNMANKVINEIQEEQIKNLDDSMLTDEAILEILKTIQKCEHFLDILLTQTEEVGGFCSFYPKECQKHLKTMKAILEFEIRK